MAPRFAPRTLLVITLTSALLSLGCGGSEPSKATETSVKAAPLKVLHTFESRGDQESGRFTAVYLQGEQLLVGSEDGLDVFTYDPAQGFVEGPRFELRASPVSKAVVHNIRPGADGLWISSSEGVARFKGGKIDLQEQSGPARDAAEFTGGLWIARSHSVEIFDPVLSQTKAFPLPKGGADLASQQSGAKAPMSVVRASDMLLALGTQFGVQVLSRSKTGAGWSHFYGPWDLPSGTTIQRMDGNSRLPGNRIYNLRMSPDGTKLAVCTDGGLALVDPNDIAGEATLYVGTHRVNKADPIRGIYHEEVPGNVEMPSSDIADVAFGEGVIYAATPKGLAVLPAAGPSAGPTRVLTIEDGLPSNKIQALAYDAPSKRLFVATGFGLAAMKAP